ncbi:MAG: hypothetical protein LBS60_03825 [Deltaproteobacteria bacterium]|nr:hypothetical protein [Deltaproteobacteria bacterium]
MEAPRGINLNLVRAQEERRALDRLVGYGGSTAASKAVGKTLSTGRVQPPALKLVVEREEAIANFKRVTHFGVELTFAALDGEADGAKISWEVVGNEIFRVSDG